MQRERPNKQRRSGERANKLKRAPPQCVLPLARFPCLGFKRAPPFAVQNNNPPHALVRAPSRRQILCRTTMAEKKVRAWVSPRRYGVRLCVCVVCVSLFVSITLFRPRVLRWRRQAVWPRRSVLGTEARFLACAPRCRPAGFTACDAAPPKNASWPTSEEGRRTNCCSGASRRGPEDRAWLSCFGASASRARR